MNYTHFVSVAGLVSNDDGETFQDALVREIKKMH